MKKEIKEKCKHLNTEWVDGGGVSGGYFRCRKCFKIIKKRSAKIKK